MSKKIDLSIVKKVFEENYDLNYDDFQDLLEKEQKSLDKKNKAKKKKEEEEAAKNVEVYHIYDSIGEDFDSVEEFLEIQISDEIDWYDTFMEEDGLPDEGVEKEEYFLVEGKLYKALIHCDAEWVGDWSVRKNLPGDKTMKTLEEIKGFEIKKQGEDWADVRLK